MKMRNNNLFFLASTTLALLFYLHTSSLASTKDDMYEASTIANTAKRFTQEPEEATKQLLNSLGTAVNFSKFRPTPSGLAGADGQFGLSLDVEGNRALVGGTGLAENGVAIVLEDQGEGWVEVAILRPADFEGGNEIGYSVSLCGDRALVSAQFMAGNGSITGSVYIFSFDGNKWDEIAKLTPADGVEGDEFGFSVDLYGDRALVGASGDDENGSRSGAAYVFEFDDSSWSETAKLAPADGAAFDSFGFSVSLVDDRALIGSIKDDDINFDSGSAYLFEFNGTSWDETAKLVPADGTSRDHFGYFVSLSGDRALVSAPFDDDNGNNSGSAYVFDFDGTNWNETVKLKPADGNSNSFGYSVSLSGERALVGAPTDSDVGFVSGSAYVFDFDGTNWNESVKITASEGNSRDQFGWSVSLSEERALIGAPFDDDNGSNSGSTFVFDFVGSSWEETAKLSPNEGASNDAFGWSVSLSDARGLIGAPFDIENRIATGSAYVFNLNGSSRGEMVKLTSSDGAGGDGFGRSVSLYGDRALVGAIRDDDNGISSGSAYVFEFNGTNWIETAKLIPTDNAAGDLFGSTVSLYSNRALVGASEDDDNGRGSGSAYVFDFDGISWLETAKITPVDGESFDEFGYSVSLSRDRALISAIDDVNGIATGSVYVYDFNGINWSETTKLTLSDQIAQSGFGYSVSLSGDRALVGVEFGSAFVFDFDGTTWVETTKLIPTDGATNDIFGSSVSLSEDRALIGARFDDDNGVDSGSAYIFDLDGTSWGETAKLTSNDGHANDQFGFSVSLADNRVLVGAIFDDDNGTNSGSAYFLDLELIYADGFESFEY